MSKKPKSLQQQLDQLYLEIQRVRDLLAGIPHDDSAGRMALLLGDTALLIKRFLDGQAYITPEMLSQCSRDLLQGYTDYQNAYKQMKGDRKNTHAPIFRQLKLLVHSYARPDTGVIRAFHGLLNAAMIERQSYAKEEGARLLKVFTPVYSPAGRAPGIQELEEMSIAATDPERVFQTLLWLGQKDAKARQDGSWSADELDHNIYHIHYLRLMTELNNAPTSTQLRYVRLFNLQEIMNRDRLAAEYAKINNQELQDTDLFRHAQAFHRMCADLTGPMGSLLRQTQNGDPRPSITARHPHIAAMLEEPVTEANKQLLRQELDRTYMDGDTADTIQFLLNDLRTTRKKPSPEFSAMARMFTDFARENHSEIADEKRYLKRLIACDRTAGLYRSYHQYDDNNPHLTLAENIIELCSRQRKAYLARHNQNADREIADLKNTVNKNTDQLVRLARLQKSAASGWLKPRIRNENPPVSRTKRFFKRLGHAMGNILTTLAAVTIGLPGNAAGIVMGTYVYLLKQPIRALFQGRMKRSVRHVVPGERDAKLHAKLSDAVDPATGILTDIRRLPLVWERPIPDDPNQPPTVSFRVLQPESGSAVVETSDHRVGHSHLCIRYSRTDPLTGRLQRYECPFGFGYKSPFDTLLNKAAMTQIGYRVPGEILPEHDALYSAEKTVEVNAGQLNTLIRYVQTYEHGGYNMIERNCTTFLADAAKVMGIREMEELLHKTDYSTESTSSRLGMLAAPIIGNLLIAANADRHALNMANRNDLSYQRLGQKIIGAEQVDRETHRTHNMRMQGYFPGTAGQAIRADAGYSLRNYDAFVPQQSQFYINKAVKDIFKSQDNDPVMAGEAEAFGVNNYHTPEDLGEHNPITATLLGLRRLFNSYMAKYFADIGTRMRGGGENYDQLLEQLQDYHDNMTRAMGKYATAALNKEPGGQSDEEAAAMGSKLANEYIDAMDHFFAVNFRSDSSAGDYFRDIVAMAQDVKIEFDIRYRTCKARHDREAILFGNTIENTRDMAGIVEDFYAGTKHSLIGKPSKKAGRVKGNATLADTMAALRVYDSLRAYLRDCIVCNELEQRDELEPAQGKELARIQRRLSAVRYMADAQKYLPLKKHFNDSNLNLLFNTLPASAIFVEDDGKSDGIHMLQCLAYEHVFQGILKAIGPALESEACKTREAIQTFSPAENVKAYNTCDQYLSTAGEMIGAELQKKLNNLTPENQLYLRKIQTCIAQRMYAQDREVDPRLAPTAKNYAQLAANEILDTLAGAYGPQILTTLHRRVDKDDLLGAIDPQNAAGDIRSKLALPAYFTEPLQGLTKEANPNLQPVM